MKYTVWVGGSEVTDYLLDHELATDIANQYLEQGYEDTVIERIEE